MNTAGIPSRQTVLSTFADGGSEGTITLFVNQVADMIADQVGIEGSLTSIG